MMDQLIVKNIVKKYHRQTVLDNISFTLDLLKFMVSLAGMGLGRRLFLIL